MKQRANILTKAPTIYFLLALLAGGCMAFLVKLMANHKPAMEKRIPKKTPNMSAPSIAANIIRYL
jgi:hypothetical protein